MCGQVRRCNAEEQNVHPLVRTHAAFLRTVAAVAVTLGLGWVLVHTPPAAAATPIVIEATDPAGDAYYRGAGEPGTDITGFRVNQDRDTNVASGSVTFVTPPSTATPASWELRIAFGKVVGTSCKIWEFGAVHVRHDLGTTSADYIVGAMTDVRRDVAISADGLTLNFATPAAPDIFSGYGFRCITVTTEKLFEDRTTDADYPADIVTAFAPADQVARPEAPVDPGKGTPAPILDADGDGVHDAADKCPKVPGAAQSGCETVPVAASIKLGTKRLVIDRLLASTAGVCPRTVKVVAKLSGKTLGKQAVGTIKKGSFCHVQAVVKLKKKVKKARVTVTGVGVTSVAATVAK